jgi:A/G-specific adenine glycosylase
MIIQNELSKARKNLLDWYKLNQRKLPFRETKDPYCIWVSEVMLQQTRVAAMLPSYLRFIKKFPDIGSLADADTEEVLAHWKGLGYYSRALNLQKGAVYLKEHHGGRFPNHLESALKIPGVGPYTARAVLSIAFGNPVAVLDGNVKRVLSRIFLYENEIGSSQAHKDLQALAEIFLDKEASGDFNQAVMELGASLCGPEPSCLICPVREFCKALEVGKQKSLPLVAKEKRKINLRFHFLWLENSGKVLVMNNPQRRFFKKLFTLPFWIEGKDLPENYKLGEVFKKFCNKSPAIYLPKKHSITHHSIEIVVHTISTETTLSKINQEEGWMSKWVQVQNLEAEFPSSLSKKIVEAMILNSQ